MFPAHQTKSSSDHDAYQNGQIVLCMCCGFETNSCPNMVKVSMWRCKCGGQGFDVEMWDVGSFRYGCVVCALATGTLFYCSIIKQKNKWHTLAAERLFFCYSLIKISKLYARLPFSLCLFFQIWEKDNTCSHHAFYSVWEYTDAHLPHVCFWCRFTFTNTYDQTRYKHGARASFLAVVTAIL